MAWALKGETGPDSLPATPKSPPTRRVPPRGPSLPAAQTQLVRDHHGQPGASLQRRHAGGDAPLDNAAAEVQGRHQSGGPGIHSER